MTNIGCYAEFKKVITNNFNFEDYKFVKHGGDEFYKMKVGNNVLRRCKVKDVYEKIFKDVIIIVNNTFLKERITTLDDNDHLIRLVYKYYCGKFTHFEEYIDKIVYDITVIIEEKYVTN